MKRGAQLALPLFVLLLGVMAWTVPPLPLDIEVHGDHAVARVQFLGEYPNNLGSVELRQTDTSRVLWRVVAKKNMVQLHNIRLAVGFNSAELQATGQSIIEIPSNAPGFVLTPNT